MVCENIGGVNDSYRTGDAQAERARCGRLISGGGQPMMFVARFISGLEWISGSGTRYTR